MDLHEIDLNLLVVFNQLLMERRVSGAAETLGLVRDSSTAPALGRSSVPNTVSIVVFPDPDGPTTATWSTLGWTRNRDTSAAAAGADASVDSASAAQVRVANRQPGASANARPAAISTATGNARKPTTLA